MTIRSGSIIKIIGENFTDEKGFRRYGLRVLDVECGNEINCITKIEFEPITAENCQRLQVKLSVFRPDINFEAVVDSITESEEPKV